MGTLVYADADIDIDVDDRALAHLQVVIGSKLRRNEDFFFSWTEHPTTGSGRSSIWMNPAIPLYFKYSGGRTPAINREWIAALMHSANSGAGLVLTPEPNGPTRVVTPIRGHI
jgi:hypothetical protein